MCKETLQVCKAEPAAHGFCPAARPQDRTLVVAFATCLPQALP